MIRMSRHATGCTSAINLPIILAKRRTVGRGGPRHHPLPPLHRRMPTRRLPALGSPQQIDPTRHSFAEQALRLGFFRDPALSTFITVEFGLLGPYLNPDRLRAGPWRFSSGTETVPSGKVHTGPFKTTHAGLPTGAARVAMRAQTFLVAGMAVRESSMSVLPEVGWAGGRRVAAFRCACLMVAVGLALWLAAVVVAVPAAHAAPSDCAASGAMASLGIRSSTPVARPYRAW